MRSGKFHFILSTAICMATMLFFLLFRDKLPDNVPVQITVGGSAGNTLPKPLVIFGLPVVFTIINFIRNLDLLKRVNAPTYKYYVIPVIALLLSIVTIWMATNVM